MSVERAKEFLVELAENDEAADRVDAAYLSAMRRVAADLGYDLSDEELVTAIVEMSGLGDNDLAEVSGFTFDMPYTCYDSVLGLMAPGGALRMFGSPSSFQKRSFGS